MDFNAVAERYDLWYESPEGRYIDNQENSLFLKLVGPKPGEGLLEVGCGTGHNILFFQKMGLKVSGVEPSGGMLDVAVRRCGGANLCPGEACSLTFPDSSFDIVAIITALEFMADPVGALKEAFRVSRKTVYLGILNQMSIIGISRRIKASLFRKSTYREARFYNIWQIKSMVRKVLPGAKITWGSALFFLFGWHRYFRWLDKILSFHRNPFGGFLGIAITKPE